MDGEENVEEEEEEEGGESMAVLAVLSAGEFSWPAKEATTSVGVGE